MDAKDFLAWLGTVVGCIGVGALLAKVLAGIIAIFEHHDDD